MVKLLTLLAFLPPSTLFKQLSSKNVIMLIQYTYIYYDLIDQSASEQNVGRLGDGRYPMAQTVKKN